MSSGGTDRADMKRKQKSIRLFSRVHAYIYRISGGRIGCKLGNQVILLLSTIGIKSGKKRHVPLAAVAYGEKYIVVGSFGGSSKDPSWITNIRNNQQVGVRIGSAKWRGETSIIEASDDCYAKLWARVISVYGGFDEYRKMTSRDIPLVIITLHDEAEDLK